MQQRLCSGSAYKVAALCLAFHICVKIFFSCFVAQSSRSYQVYNLFKENVSVMTGTVGRSNQLPILTNTSFNTKSFAKISPAELIPTTL